MFAIDGALFRTADTPELREHFGSGNTGSDRQTPYPLCRVVTVMNVHSYVLLDAQINSYRTNEMKLASDMLDKLPDNSVTLLDKGFFSAALLHHIHKRAISGIGYCQCVRAVYTKWLQTMGTATS